MAWVNDWDQWRHIDGWSDNPLLGSTPSGGGSDSADDYAGEGDEYAGLDDGYAGGED